MRSLVTALIVLFLVSGASVGQVDNSKNPFRNWTFQSEHGDYLDEIKSELSKDQIPLRVHHFQEFPIKYWIEPVNKKWGNIIRSAFGDYNYFIPMVEVNSEVNADIVVNIVDDEKLKEIRMDEAIGVAGLQYKDNRLRGVIKLHSDTFDTPFKNYSKRIVKHEIAHALGLAGHSDCANDLMYPEGNFEFCPDGKTIEIGETRLIRAIRLMDAFTGRDLNTLWLLYNEW